MQPFAREPAGTAGLCFEQRDAGTPLRVGKRAHTADGAGTDDGDIVVRSTGAGDAARVIRWYTRGYVIVPMPSDSHCLIRRRARWTRPSVNLSDLRRAETVPSIMRMLAMRGV